MENILDKPIFQPRTDRGQSDKEIKSIFNVPLKVGMKVGKNWGTCEDYSI